MDTTLPLGWTCICVNKVSGPYCWTVQRNRCPMLFQTADVRAARVFCRLLEWVRYDFDLFLVIAFIMISCILYKYLIHWYKDFIHSNAFSGTTVSYAIGILICAKNCQHLLFSIFVAINAMDQWGNIFYSNCKFNHINNE